LERHFAESLFHGNGGEEWGIVGKKVGMHDSPWLLQRAWSRITDRFNASIKADSRLCHLTQIIALKLRTKYFADRCALDEMTADEKQSVTVIETQQSVTESQHWPEKGLA